MPLSHRRPAALATTLSATLMAVALQPPIATQSKPGPIQVEPALAHITHLPAKKLAILPAYQLIKDTNSIVPFLASRHAHVRARALVLLRQKLGLQVPTSTIAATKAAIYMRQSPWPVLRDRRLTTDLAQTALAQLATATTMPPVLAADPSELSARERHRIAQQLIAYATKPPSTNGSPARIIWRQGRGMTAMAADPAGGRIETSRQPPSMLSEPGPGPRPAPSANPAATYVRARSLPGMLATERALACYAVALKLHPPACEALLAIAVNSPDPAAKACALIAVEAEAGRRYWRKLPPLADDCAPLAMALLDTADKADRHTAANILDLVLRPDSDPAVLADLHSRACKHLAHNIGILSIQLRPASGCVPRSVSAKRASSAEGQLVLTSARLGNRDLLPPLIRSIRKNKNRHGGNATFVSLALRHLAPFTTPEQARRLFAPLAERSNSILGAHSQRALAGLYATGDDKLLDRLEALHERRHVPMFWNSMQELSGQLSDARIERLLLIKPRREKKSTLRYQDQLRQALLARTRSRESLGDSIIARSNTRHPLTLVHESYVRWGQSKPRIKGPFARSLRNCTATPEQLPLLHAFADDEDYLIAIAAATRAFGLSEAGRRWSQTVLTKLCAKSLPARTAALREAVRLGLAPDDWQATAVALFMSSEVAAHHVAAAAWVRFQPYDGELAGAGPKQPISPYAVPMVIPHADLDTIRKLVRTVEDFAKVQHITNPATMVAMMEHAATFTDWPEDLERIIVHATTDVLPNVRRAAYAALATRDRSQCLPAWLALEAQFDSNETVRLTAPTR